MFARDKTSFLRFGRTDYVTCCRNPLLRFRCSVLCIYGDSRKEVGEIKKSSIFVL